MVMIKIKLQIVIVNAKIIKSFVITFLVTEELIQKLNIYQNSKWQNAL